MISKIIAVGDSFLYGNELPDCTPEKPSNLTWPALIAQEMGLQYQSLSKPGHSVQFVLRELIESVTKENNVFYIILWPSANRYEYLNKDNNNWTQLTPNNILNGTDMSPDIHKLYYSHVNSLLGDKWQNLLCIYTALQVLKNSKNLFSMSVISDFIYNTEWHNPPYVKFLQDETKPYITQFDGLNFVDWANKCNFPIGIRMHPLTEAHAAAAKYWVSAYQTLL